MSNVSEFGMNALRKGQGNGQATAHRGADHLQVAGGRRFTRPCSAPGTSIEIIVLGSRGDQVKLVHVGSVHDVFKCRISCPDLVVGCLQIGVVSVRGPSRGLIPNYG